MLKREEIDGPDAIHADDVRAGTRGDARDGTRAGSAGIRIAAVGDLNMAVGRRGELRPRLAAVSEFADVLLLAGGLTEAGLVSEAEVLAHDLDRLGVPIVAVLGARDHQAGHESLIRAVLTSMGWTVLEASTAVIETRGLRLGIAGMTGFPGGFGTDFDLWSAVREHRRADRETVKAERFGRALAALAEQNTDVRIALTHYAPSPATLDGEPEADRPNLGNELLGRTIDEFGADIAVHAMSRHGVHRGQTFGATPVYNVSQPVLDAPCAVITLPAGARQGIYSLR